MGPGAYSYTNSKGDIYYLHAQDVTLKNGRLQQIFYFCKNERENTINELPAGYEIVESERTGLPLLKKVR